MHPLKKTMYDLKWCLPRQHIHCNQLVTVAATNTLRQHNETLDEETDPKDQAFHLESTLNNDAFLTLSMCITGIMTNRPMLIECHAY